MQDQHEQHPEDADVQLDSVDAEDSAEEDEASSEEAASGDEERRAELPPPVVTNIPLELQEGVQCLKHALNNVLLAWGGGNITASEEHFEEAAASLNEHLLRVEHIPAEAFGNREGYLVEVAERFLASRLPCCRIQHS